MDPVENGTPSAILPPVLDHASIPGAGQEQMNSHSGGKLLRTV